MSWQFWQRIELRVQESPVISAMIFRLKTALGQKPDPGTKSFNDMKLCLSAAAARRNTIALPTS
jgi:hypothetical protein